MTHRLLMLVAVTLMEFIAAGQNGSILEKIEGRYRIRIQNQFLEIDPSTGGRITSLVLNGQNFLTGRDVNDFNWGSTFWISPQSEWKWPPSASIDNKPYSVSVTGEELMLISEKDPKTGLVVTKKFKGDNKDGSFILTYIITNRSDTIRMVAPWEITRVHTNGLSFFPVGKGLRRGNLLPLTKEKEGVCWFVYNQSELPSHGDPQLYSDGAEGWLAHINENIIFIKKFPDIPFEKNAPNEGEIELYASPVTKGKAYVEIEQQGAYAILHPGESLTWEVTWYIRELPTSLSRQAGDSSLVDFVRGLLNTTEIHSPSIP